MLNSAWVRCQMYASAGAFVSHKLVPRGQRSAVTISYATFRSFYRLKVAAEGDVARSRVRAET